MTTPADAQAAYDTSVFVNCPFDPEYRPLFRALVFTVEYCGVAARCALELDGSGETRAEKIIRLIRDSRYGVHDISRTGTNAVDGEARYARFTALIPTLLAALNKTVADLDNYHDFHRLVGDWLTQNAATRSPGG